jgi:hypothetical protein
MVKMGTIVAFLLLIPVGLFCFFSCWLVYCERKERGRKKKDV